MPVSQLVLSELLFFGPLVALLILDLYSHRKHPTQTFKQAMLWMVLWISLAFFFNVYLYFEYGSGTALAFLTGYVVEQSLSVDNLFVIMLIFSSFAVPKNAQHRVLFWGIFGAFVMRGVMIFAGVTLIERFDWLMLVFGAFLIFTGIKTGLKKDGEEDPTHNPIIGLIKKVIPISDEYHKDHFFTRNAGKLMATPLFLALCVIEVTDLVFAVDSIPAILAISTDPFVVVTSNFFAILGLRSMYFVLNHFLKYFHYLKYGLAVILTFIGVKMVLIHYIHIPILLSLMVIFFTLTITVLLSLAFPPKKPTH